MQEFVKTGFQSSAHLEQKGMKQSNNYFKECL